MIVALNNKCNLNKEDYLNYLKELNNIETNHKMILAPTSINIGLTDIKFSLAAQNVSCEEKGAHTGEVSAEQLKSYNVEYCIVGHSERRKDQKETNEEIKRKIERLFDQDITPILCCGETKEEREQGIEKDIIKEELSVALDSLDEEKRNRVIIAYEPIWSIGTGLIPNLDDIIKVNNFIGEMLPYNKVVYGGSANEENIESLKSEEVDGYLLGGLSLKPQQLQTFIDKL